MTLRNAWQEAARLAVVCHDNLVVVGLLELDLGTALHIGIACAAIIRIPAGWRTSFNQSVSGCSGLGGQDVGIQSFEHVARAALRHQFILLLKAV